MKRRVDYAPPFPWFGGKSPVSATVWAALGNVANYVEPFFGSGAVLFLRPVVGHIETVNDADGFVANFWRALQREPDAVAEHADNPVNEADMHARHLPGTSSSTWRDTSTRAGWRICGRLPGISNG